MLARFRRFIRKIQASEKLDLSYILGHARTEAPLAEQVDWAAALVEWIRHRDEAQQTGPNTRIRFILQLLDRHPDWKSSSAKVLRGLLRQTKHARLYSEVGLPSRPTFGSEFRIRLVRVFVPEFEDPENLAGVHARIFYDDNDAAWLDEVPEELVREIVLWLRTDLPPDEPLLPGWRDEVLDAARILSSRILAITWREDFCRRTPEFSLSDHPMARLHDHLGVFRRHWNSGQSLHAEFNALRQDVADGRRLIQSVRSHLEQTGVSVDLVYQLDRVRNDLVRLNRLISLLEADTNRADLTPLIHHFIVELTRGHERDGDLLSILRKNFGLLSRKIVERTGHSGEHYITQNRHEYYHMLMMAGGGGLLTAFTAFFKYLHAGNNWPLFVEFFYNGTNYSVSFLIMHFLGFKLATKQPSMTAAALAGKLKEDPAESDDEDFVNEIARISRSQFAAVVGNLVAVIPAALAIDAICRLNSDQAFLTPQRSEYVLHSVHPLLSATLPYAAFTGILLWLSSMTAGWVENASVYSRVPEILRTHPLLRWIFGQKRAQKIAGAYMDNVSGVVGSIALGFFLAAAPIFGTFFGLPVDVRHVTLTTGAVAYSVSSLGWENVSSAVLAWTAIGVALIGALNFGVSFFMALMIALRARDVSGSRTRSIFRLAFRRLLRRPGMFLLPPR